MKEHLRFTICYWHTFRGSGADPFGMGTMQWPWDDGSDSVENACNRARVAFEFFEKLDAPFYAFHELDYAGMQGALGSIDANTGDLLLGWDTDQFPTDYYLTTQTMLCLLKYGLAPGGVNFDAKVRRESFEPIDLFHAHIGGMDAFAKGLKVAAAIRADNALGQIVQERYSSWDGELGKKIESGSVGFKELEALMLEKGDAQIQRSGRQELCENIVNRYLDKI